ncbi:hypothetical protein KP79_PYT24693 [Mizuhopecten yessoensis]|uniref:Uncharacterized protein n=1 Tax=Mizuhopecten yessoensis TaxID=6573 RepID=A0A210QRI9_MIZYE|nr:hypothetical protein KP79_PYT24693 [Mizuhopecten yessoensis]
MSVIHAPLRLLACRVHVAFHGGKQGRDDLGDKFARHAGYNDVGEENDVIIIYPQVKADMIQTAVLIGGAIQMLILQTKMASK